VRSSLRSRLALLLVLANLPAAALAIGATVKGRDAEVAQREFGLVQRAELIAMRAGLTLGIAEGVADTLAANPDVASAGAHCSGHLEAALALRPEYTGIIVSGPTGQILCSFGDTEVSSEGRSALLRAIRNTEDVGDAVFLPEQIPPKDPVVLVSRPFTAGTERRAIGLLLRRDVFDAIFLPADPDTKEIGALALIRSGGVIVSEFIEGADGKDWRPAEVLPTGAVDEPGVGLALPTRDGVPFHYAVAPVRGTLSNVVLATPMATIAATDWMRFLLALGAPLLMLLLGILAIFAGIDRLVLRWIVRFRQVTAAYAGGDYSPRIAQLEAAPAELADLGAGINDMAQHVQERSTALEEALAGKNALLRELHHRVKNNFQMIASLLALQRRELPQRLRMLLRVPEDRVLAMAAAYKASYATGEIGHVSTVDLLRDIASQLRQSFGMGAPPIKVEGPEEPIWLDLDQAVPLGLLVSELITPVLERADASEHPITIQARRSEPGVLDIEIESRKIVDAVPATGLAERLVNAYRSQIGATIAYPSDDVALIAIPMQGGTTAHPGRVEFGT
jgi:two-component sensor histidine kinase